ncbi:MAG: redoxin domain-containing protein [Actinobacteria bacterium]|nr:redoxin domain-containing protein [Actinomycetota bacterium]MDQ3532735.1 peroxiredoxin family protein [Actinomycetota bacterium]
MTRADAGSAGQAPPAGHPAPDFTLPSSVGDPVTLKELRGRPVILAFYPSDWSPTCSDQMSLYQDVAPELGRFDAHLRSSA